MSNDISIQVTIGGRKYPLTVSKKDEEMVKSVASELDNAVTTLKKNYAVQDRQDLMAMAALQVAVKKATANKNNSVNTAENDIFKELNDLLLKSESLLQSQ